MVISAKTSVAIIIPAYNEALSIGGLVKAISDILSREKYHFEIVVVDDASRDDTAREAREAGATIISHILNAGTGGATASGLSYAQQNDFTLAATLDGDGQHSPEDLVRGIKLMLDDETKTDLLIGSRLIDSDGMSRVKILGNKGLSFLTFMMFGIRVTDSQSGLRVFSKTALDRLKWKTSGYEFCSEMLWRARQQNLKISEYPIQAIYTEYSRSKGQSNWNAVNIVKSLVQRRILELFGE